jgi:endonuclease/exonuclease/phosphatase (EEP) superfamily protein YafD
MKYQIKFSLFILAFAVPVITGAAQLSRTFSEQVPLSVFGHSGNLKEKMPRQFQVLVWNIHKAADEKLLPDFASLAKFAELSLFQEAIDESSWVEKLKSEKSDFSWALAQSFQTNQGYYTGVATGSSVQFTTRLGYRSKPTEPVTNTPKTMLMSDYLLENGKTLRVFNVHGINFVSNSEFYIQVEQIVGLLQDHQGPLLVAGDFNTWNSDRKKYLVESLASIGLKHVELERHGLLELDHVFIRGLELVKADVVEDVDSSDHKPILVELLAP